MAAVLLTVGQVDDLNKPQPNNSFIFGVIPVVIGSMLAGVATTVSQKVLQNDNKNTYLYTAELSAWGIVSLIFISFTDYKEIQAGGVFKGWTIFTMIPVLTNTFGGVIIGLVMKYAGGVRKGFSTVTGMFLTAVLSYFLEYRPLSMSTWIAVVLLIVSVYVHTSYPYQPVTTRKVEVVITTPDNIFIQKIETIDQTNFKEKLLRT